MEKINNGAKWGAKDKFIFKPKWSRWKLHLQISDNKWREYFSYDYHNVFVNSVKMKAYGEKMALVNMLVRIREKHPTGYKYGNVFSNFSDDLSTEKKNYNHLVFTMTPTKTTWRQEIFYYETPITGSGYVNERVNTEKTLKHWKYKEQIEIITPAQARAEVFNAIHK